MKKKTDKCDGTRHIVNSQIDPTEKEIKISCTDNTGVYDIPPTWPNCTETVNCGPPPSKQTNGIINGTTGHDGSITWLNDAPPGRDTYNTHVTYKCVEGSQFDKTGPSGSPDDVGDTLSITQRCQWNKSWSPYPSTMPQCKVTHCTKPFDPPYPAFLEEITANWTAVGDSKEYQCKDKQGTAHTRFFESDRALSTFYIKCNVDGSFEVPSWPTCIKDIECDEPAPEIPTHSEYTLAKDDGYVLINSLEYPTLTRTLNATKNSTAPASELPRNYMANLTYSCGAAREFSSGLTQSMTCQWNREWSPTQVLEPCDWVACLKPPQPPRTSNLRVSDWDGAPIAFGGTARYVCDRGMFFEEDPALVDQYYTCQDGSVTGNLKGFFDVPSEEEDWPRCLMAPLCPTPPEVPEDGWRDFIPIVFELQPENSCEITGGMMELKCHTFLRVYIQTARYGRSVSNERSLCDKDKGRDSGAPSVDCLDHSLALHTAKETCQGKSSCSIMIEPDMAALTGCDTLKKELRVEHICVECRDWAAYPEAQDCMQAALLHNNWATPEALDGLEEADKKSRLINEINLKMDPSIHTVMELSLRPVEAEQGGLCGLAALYLALKDTIMTKSQLATMSYDTAREQIAGEMNLATTVARDLSDSDLLLHFYDCK